jgi:hypothetical protein
MSKPEKYLGPGLAAVATAIVLAVVRSKWASKRPPYPPGPKGFPIIGNILDFPKAPIWEGLTKMAQDYGEQRVLSRLALLVPWWCLTGSQIRMSCT